VHGNSIALPCDIRHKQGRHSAEMRRRLPK
jgi:hypothetical protein